MTSLVPTVLPTELPTDLPNVVIRTDGELSVCYLPCTCFTCFVCGSFEDKPVFVGCTLCCCCIPLPVCVCCIRQKYRKVEWKDTCCQSTGNSYQTPPWWWWYSRPYDADNSSNECYQCECECCFDGCDFLVNCLGLVLQCAVSVILCVQ